MPKLLEILAIFWIDESRVVIMNPNAPGGPARLMECTYDEFTKIAQMYEFVGYKIEKVEFKPDEIRVLYKLEV